MNLSNSLGYTPSSTTRKAPLICFSHLRWDFVLQRPQHLMSRFAKDRQVFFFEEAITTDHHLAYFEIHGFPDTTVKSVRPRIPHGWNEQERGQALGKLLDELIELYGSPRPVLWFYTPMMYSFASHIDACAVVYDCMDELANFRFAPTELKTTEAALLARSDVVFTGGHSLYEAKRHLHDNIHSFPSSVDVSHFGTSRRGNSIEPEDQRAIHGPKLGYYGVIDERLDLELIGAVARSRPELSFIFVGPVVKVTEEELPKAANIHYLGQKHYNDLPVYLSGWDAALMPFARNEATRFISPTKTPEYLASGRPVVSTSVKDVVRSYSGMEGVFFADDAETFASACDRSLRLKQTGDEWLVPVDDMLSRSSWDATFWSMNALVNEVETRPTRPARIASPKVGLASKAYDYLIVGAGFAGSVLAERLASDGHTRVLICDRRPHVGGNAYDFFNEDGILVHRYGPHIFHTNSEDVFNYLSRFTAWRPYEHRVLANVGDMHLPVPINRTTLNGLYGLDLSDDAEAARFLSSRAEPCGVIETSKDVVVSQIGTHLYRTFFEGYTRKQWGLDPSQLDKSVTARVPTRTNTDDRYFLDAYQAMPMNGYTAMFEKMLEHENITVMTDTDYHGIRDEVSVSHTIFTGPIDEYYEHRFGKLPYRSLKFVHETHDLRQILPVGVVNFPDEKIPYTRMTEYKHLTGQIHAKTSISYEYATSEGDPYYPIPRAENQALYKQYEALSRQQDNVTFVGRLGTYKYYNMDQVVGQALATYRRLSRSPVEAAVESAQ